VLVFGCAYWRSADGSCSDTTCLESRGWSARRDRPEGQADTAYGHKGWVVERTSYWHNAHEKLSYCTERREQGLTSGWPSPT